MPRGIYNRTAATRGAALTTSAAKIVTLVPESAYTELNWWDRLDVNEQKAVKTEGEHLAVALLNHGRSRLAIGEHLLNIQKVLEPKNLFVKFLKNFHFSTKTAYRYMNGFKNAQRELPESVLSAAMARGYNMIGDSEQKPLGIYTSAVRQLPPPANPTAEQANQWLDSVEQVRKKTRSTPAPEFAPEQEAAAVDPELLLKECYRFIENRFKKLPDNARQRQRFMRDLISYEMTLVGIEKSTPFMPKTPPSDFKAERGRPKLLNMPTQAA
jgi:hypothetical protein